ncbi:hypothetical protein D3C86_1313990 [compost metagenome]
MGRVVTDQLVTVGAVPVPVMLIEALSLRELAVRSPMLTPLAMLLFRTAPVVPSSTSMVQVEFAGTLRVKVTVFQADPAGRAIAAVVEAALPPEVEWVRTPPAYLNLNRLMALAL